jgi:hypothetical protein
MSSIGDVSATLRATFGPYVNETLKAASATGGLRVAQEHAEMSTAELSQRLLYLEGVIDGMTEEIQHYASRMGQAAEKTEAVAQASPLATRGMNMIRGASNTLAAQVFGLSGAVGTLGQGLMFFAAGSATVTGIVAGIAVIGLAWKALTKETREQKEEVDALLKKYLALSEANLPIPEQIKNIENDIARLTEARRQFITESLGSVRVALAQASGTGFRMSEFTADQQETLRGFDRAIGAAQALRNETGSLRREWTITAEETKKVVDNIVKADMFTAIWREKFEELGETAKTAFEPLKQSATDTFQSLRGQLEKTAEYAGTIGASVTRTIVGGMLGRKKDVAQALKDIFVSAVEELIAALAKKGIIDALLNALTGGIKGGAQALGGGKIPILGDLPIIGGLFSSRGVPTANPEGLARASVAGGPSLTFVMPAAAHNPLTASRDAEWQEFLKESFVVAQMQGLKVQVA